MQTTNQQAMDELTKAKALAHESQYRFGYFYGLASAYWMSDTITFDQYKELTFTRAQLDAYKISVVHSA